MVEPEAVSSGAALSVTSSAEIECVDDVCQAYERVGPHLTILGRRPTSDSRKDEATTRWHAHAHVLRQASRHGSAKALDQLEAAYMSLPNDGAVYLVTANPESALHCRIAESEFDEKPRRLVGRSPRLVPALHQVMSRKTTVGALVDRGGATIYVSTNAPGEVARHAATVEGDTEYIHRTAQGGWSQRNYQAHTEHVWDLNAELVALRITSEAKLVGAKAIRLSGDVRATNLVVDHLPRSLKQTTQIVHAGGPGHIDAPARLNEVLHEASSSLAADAVCEALDELAAASVNSRTSDQFGEVTAGLIHHQVESMVVRSDMPVHDWLDFVVRDALANNVPITIAPHDDGRISGQALRTVMRPALSVDKP